MATFSKRSSLMRKEAEDDTSILDPKSDASRNNSKNIMMRFLLELRILSFKKFKRAIERDKDGFLSSLLRNVFDNGSQKTKEYSMHVVLRHWGIEMDHETSELEYRASIVIQTKVRIWLLQRKRSPVRSYNEQNPSKSLILIQAAIRRWLTKRNLVESISEKKKFDDIFDNFCWKLHEGVKINMFSRKYGTLNERNFRLCPEQRYLTWKVSGNTVKKLPLRSIYKVTKGISSYKYAQRPKNPGWCFSLHCLEGRTIDLEATQGDLFRLLFAGFERLILLMDGESPFYIDERGAPCRAGPSIIRYALERAEMKMREKKEINTLGNIAQISNFFRRSDNASKPSNDKPIVSSKADEMRFVEALKALRIEYETWIILQDKEYNAWRKKSHEVRSVRQRDNYAGGDGEASQEGDKPARRFELPPGSGSSHLDPANDVAGQEKGMVGSTPPGDVTGRINGRSSLNGNKAGASSRSVIKFLMAEESDDEEKENF